ncbi:deoxyribodipyrimidine photo-lyase, putative [Plasmodium sp. gorilla clade G2]|uniref:deoxyribodipyrimidine photo-lyase, putative n=1 Tax=Plasmodium sp. gorilla clade G2 TaxID=880535 RepID=UPI000D21F8EE|nr:deoxyribodipyrimidine photo-lyase, putative [Plasmodium sp. gorilla clade G2]SOV11661.1 deoxyribodipyrimidine photo-lyase, putative [Plasmodium sp. gorilla clade G2]
MASDKDNNKVDVMLYEPLKNKDSNILEKCQHIKKLNEENKKEKIIIDGQENSLDEKRKKNIIKNNEDILRNGNNNMKNDNKPQVHINKGITISDKKNNKNDISIIEESKRMDLMSSYDEEKKEITTNEKENDVNEKKKKNIIINNEDILKDNNNNMRNNILNMNVNKDENILSEKGNKTDISSILTDENKKKQVSFFSQVEKNIIQQSKGNIEKKKKNINEEKEEKEELYSKETTNNILSTEQFNEDISNTKILKKNEIHNKPTEKNNISVKEKNHINTSSKSNIYIVWKKNISVSSQQNISVPSQKNISVSSQKNISIPSQKNISIPSQKNISVSSQKNISIPSQKNISIPSQKNISIPSQKNISIPSQNNISIPSQNNAPTNTLITSQNNKVTKIIKSINEKEQNKGNDRKTKYNDNNNTKNLTCSSKILRKDLNKQKSNTEVSKKNTLNICSFATNTIKETTLISDKKKKKNPYETSLETKLNILNKRVRCLTSFEHSKDGSTNIRNNQTAGKFKELLLSHESITKNNKITNGGNLLNNNISCDNMNSNNISPEHNSCDYNKNNVLLLLTRDFRIKDNWALIYAYEQAKKKKTNLYACTYLNRKEEFPKRHIDIKLKVLKNLEENMKKQLNIPFYVLAIYMIDEFMEFLRIHEIKTIICDFNPLNETKTFIQNLVELSNKKKIKIIQVDSHNIVPMWITSNIEENSSRTIKPKIQTHLSTFLIEFIQLEMFDQTIKYPEPFSISEVFNKLTVYIPCPVLLNFVCTEEKAHETLQNFCSYKLEKYNLKKNDPNSEMTNLLTPYINFGIISSQRCVLEVNKYAHNFPSINTIRGKETFNEEIVMKKELADNFCYYNKNYDNFNGGKDWAKDSLKKHDADKREYLYDYEDFKNAKTHEDLWNCAQLQLINEGIIHEFLRMYWCKQILNWSGNSKTALKYAMKLNDDFSIDAKSPYGYVSIMSSIMAVHDQSWNERNIFGKIRYMNYNSCKRHFDINYYMQKYPRGKENALIVQKIPTITFSNYIRKRKNDNLTLPQCRKEKREKK